MKSKKKTHSGLFFRARSLLDEVLFFEELDFFHVVSLNYFYLFDFHISLSRNGSSTLTRLKGSFHFWFICLCEGVFFFSIFAHRSSHTFQSRISDTTTRWYSLPVLIFTFCFKNFNLDKNSHYFCWPIWIFCKFHTPFAYQLINFLSFS